MKCSGITHHLRLRIERKLRKRLRRMRHDKVHRDLVRTVQRYERDGLRLDRALRTIVTDHDAGWFERGNAARVLAIAEGKGVSERLLKQFFSQQGKNELWETALTLEQLGDLRSATGGRWLARHWRCSVS